MLEAGFRDHFDGGNICLVEWPERAAGLLPQMDLAIFLATERAGRKLKIVAETERGRHCLKDAGKLNDPRQRLRTRAARPARTSSAVASIVLLLVCIPGYCRNRYRLGKRCGPRQEYTRLTLESQSPITHNVFTIGGPDRLVLDLEDIDSNAAVESLSSKISPDDPYVSGIRIGRFKPGTVRLVLDLKTQVKPQTFMLQPIGEYGYRLVLDIYPAEPADPIVALLENNKPATVIVPAPVAPPAPADKTATGPNPSPADPKAPKKPAPASRR